MLSKPDSQIQSLCLEITRGRTQHRVRPIRSDRFLIGSGEWCQLRLGGDTPALHSVLVNKNGMLTIEAIASEPALLVNGQCVESAELHDGDELSVGSISMILHGESDGLADPLMQPIDIEALLALDQPAESIPELSASEIVDRLEIDMALVATWEDGREDAAESLIDAAARVRRSVDEQADRPRRILRELETAVESLNKIAADLAHDTNGMSDHEIGQAASSLVDYQQQIVGRLDDVLRRIAGLKEIDQQKVA